ncbi:MAG: N-6 DNA methylase [Pyrinomonadaceae bacterium]
MSLSLNKHKLDNLANEIWKSAERLRGKFKAYEYQGVILPIIVIRRLECVLVKWREDKKAEIRAKQPNRSEKELDALVKNLELNPKLAPFSNKTNWTLRKIYEEDHTLLEENFRDYINGFSANVQDIIDHFDYRAVIGRMVKNSRLAPILNQYSTLDVSPDRLSNLEMGYIYEELLRRFSEQSGEEAGEHFTPREVVRLMVELLEIPLPDRHCSIYDPACGTGGMLSVAKEHLLDRAETEEEKRRVENLVTVHGQELQPANYAICKADMLIKNDKQAQVFLGNSLIPDDQQSRDRGDQLPESKHRFDYMLSNPPFGVVWGGKDGYEKEARKLEKTRYKAGMPRIDDGALLFLQTMLAKMKEPGKGSSRVAILFNGSPLSNGDCGSAESEIRRWILENDWLDAIVMLPDQLFYNTGIFTYVWLLRSEKPDSHKGRVMIIDARKQFEKEPKSFGNKRNRMTDAHRQWIEERYHYGWDGRYSDEHVKFFRKEDFAYHKVKVVFWQTDEHDQPGIVTEPYRKNFTAQNISKEQEFYESDLYFNVRLRELETGRIETISFNLKREDSFIKVYESLVRRAFAIEIESKTKDLESAKEKNRVMKQFIESLHVEAEWTHRDYVKDDEYISHGQDIEAFLTREIAKPIIRWKDSSQLGYEILPNKYFYRYQPPTPTEDLLTEFWRLEKEAEKMLEVLAVK